MRDIKKERDGRFERTATGQAAFPEQPKYRDEWYRMIVKGCRGHVCGGHQPVGRRLQLQMLSLLRKEMFSRTEASTSWSKSRSPSLWKATRTGST